MAKEDEAFLDEFLNDNQAQAPQSETMSAPASTPISSDGFDLDSWLSEYQDPITGDDLPDYANGSQPDFAKAQSPLQYEDRLKLSFANKEGKISYLKSKFEDAKLDSTGRAVVKKDGQWFQADVDNDPWETTKNLIKGAGKAAIGKQLSPEETEAGFDVFVDPLKEYGLAAASIGAGVLTGGASLGVQAAGAGLAGLSAAGVTTSLGRAAGTYQATGEEQVQDIAMEGLLNLGGTYVAAGIKPTAKLVAEGVKKLGSAFKAVPEASKDVIKGSLGKLAGLSNSQMDEVFENADLVSNTLKRFGNESGEVAAQLLQKEKVEKVALIAKNAQAALSNAYDDMATKIADSVPETFSFEAKDIVKPIMSDAFDNGFVKFSTKGGDLVGPAAKEAWESGTAGKIVVNSRDDVVSYLNRELGQALDLPKETYNKLAGFLDDVVVQTTGLKKLTGKDGFKQLMNLKKQLGNMTYDLADDEIPDLANRFRQYGVQIADAAVSKMSEQSPNAARMYGQLQKDYSLMKNSIEPVARAFRQFNKTGNADLLNSMVQQVVSSRPTAMAKKTAFEEAVGLLEKFGGKNRAKDWMNVYKDIKVLDAAQGFAPWIKGNVYSAGVGIAGAAGLGPAGVLLSAAGSPRALLYGAQGFQALNKAASNAVMSSAAKFSTAGRDGARQMLKQLPPSSLQTLNKAGFQALNFIKGAGPKGAQVLRNNPQMLDAFVKSIIQVPDVKESLKGQLVGSAIDEASQYE